MANTTKTPKTPVNVTASQSKSLQRELGQASKLLSPSFVAHLERQDRRQKGKTPPSSPATSPGDNNEDAELPVKRPNESLDAIDETTLFTHQEMEKYTRILGLIFSNHGCT
eukprot:TRINITY_DN75282_c0_g1_i1.p1 TRINITY_DN75282_c0_g1~~TRINITY_DN75282_c0_g1_i1.p1  ORF type:complete len:128 (-),score=14.73 TRINITY_DN75282_c0_g1_i1:210-542(-)